MNMQTPGGNEQRATTPALGRGNRMETRAGSAASSTHCSGHCLCLPSRHQLLKSHSVPVPGSSPVRGAGAGRAWGWVCGTEEEGAKKTSPCAAGVSAERRMKGLELSQPVCLLLALPTPPACPKDWHGAAAEPGQAGNHQHLLAHHSTNTSEIRTGASRCSGPSIITPHPQDRTAMARQVPNRPSTTWQQGW